MTRKNRFVPVLATLLATTLAATACGSGSGSGESGGDTKQLNIGVHVEPTDWSPSRVQVILFPFTRQVYDSLITYNDTLEPSPSLATEWKINPEHTGITVTLREGVKFHSGTPLTAEAVAANLKYFADPKTGQQLLGPMAVVKEWKAVDEKTLEVTFKQPLAELQITDLLQSWSIGDPASLADTKKGVGTGPYKFSEWVPGQRIVLERNADYWGGAPAYEKLHYRVFGDMDSLIAGFESGVVDVGVDVPPLQAERLKGKNTVLVGNQGALIDQWRINPTVAPFDNENVRKAINYATDRKSISEALYRSYAGPTALPYGPNSPAYDKALDESLGYDLERARTLIASSGLSKEQLTGSIMVTSANASTTQAAQVLQAALGQIGFTLKVDVRDHAEYTEKMLVGDFGLVFASIGNAQKFPTRITTNSIYRLENNPVGAVEAFPDYAPAVAAANAAVTEEEQKKAFAALNEVLVRTMGVVTIGYLPTLWVVSPDVTGVNRDVDNMLLLGGAKPKG